MHIRSALILFLALSLAGAAVAQDGSLRGYVTDDTGAALPGVTVTGASDVLIGGTRTAVTDATGYYRLINLPPGEYTLTAELPSFASYRREGILVRAGATFSVDVQMSLSSVQETITVTAETPMLEIAKPSNVLNIDGEFMTDMPLQARRNWSDFLELTPGVNARPFDDGSGRMVYFGHATEHFAHVSQLDGMTFGGYQDFQLTYMGLPTDAVEDTQVKTGGVDASSPTATGLVINIVTKSGGNNFSGSAVYSFQPESFNGDNTGGAGTPTKSIVNQVDLTFGGPIQQDKVWFFGALRYADLEAGISRTPKNAEDLEAFFPGFDFFNNVTETTQPYVKVTAQLNPNHQLSGSYQNDRAFATGDREYHYTQNSTIYSTGGSLFSGKLSSVWGQNLTSQITMGYNNKGSSDASTYEGRELVGPEVRIHRDAFLSAGRVTGSGRLISGGGRADGNESYLPSSLVMMRADFTYYKDSWGGSHEFQTGFFGAPRNTYDQVSNYINGGFILEEVRQLDPDDPSAGTVPFHRQYRNPTSILTREARERDYGIYLQDSWKPHNRLTLNLGIRADFIKRHDNIFDIDRMNDTAIAPRLGFSYMLTKDARNVIRGSYIRAYEQVMGRDAVTLFGATGRTDEIDEYDADGDGIFEIRNVAPAVTASLGGFEFDPDLHQPFVDEFILGFRKQFVGELAVDVAVINREYQDTYARTDVNGIYPDGPGQPFIGFGRIDPARGILYQQTNNSWSTLNYTALEITATKNLRNDFQFMAGINKQWQSIQGDWNPTDPARFIQPDTFANNHGLYMPRGNNEDNSLPAPGSTTLTYGPTWLDFSVRLGGTYFAPKGFVVGVSYSLVAGPWSGPVVTRLDPNDPDVTRFGPARVPVVGGTQPNPLNTTIRNAYENRGEGQVRLPAVGTLGVKIGKKIPLGGTKEAEISANLMNLLNADGYWQYNYNGASELFNPNYLQPRNQQYPRSLQMMFAFRF
jgi:Carboxypeptidase regulatory-like domain/TonB dependent receptor